MADSILKQDPNTETFTKNAIYYDKNTTCKSGGGGGGGG